MTTTPPTSPVAEQAERARLLAVEVGDWPGLEQAVRLELDARTTVLVGKNGAGKSLLLEGIDLASRGARALPEPRPGLFRCDVESRAGHAFAFEYRAEARGVFEESDVPGASAQSPLPPWSERAFRLEDGAELWHVSEGTLQVIGKAPRPILRGVLWGYSPQEDPEIQTATGELRDLLRGFRFVPPGTLGREKMADVRRPVLLQRKEAQERRDSWKWGAMGSSDVDSLGEGIAALRERSSAQFGELCEVLRGLGIVRDIDVQIYQEQHPGKGGKPTSGDVAAVLFDGENLGFCSDGTLRITRIVLEMLRPQVSCLLIEEPETAVHPGLLDKLLALVEAYSADRQIVLSTHSPQVVDRFAPDQIRLVEREEGVTRVHSLSATDRDLAISYLRDQGSLSDFVFRRSDG